MQEEEKKNEYIQKNSPDGGFLQSREWINFQKSAGRKTHKFEQENFVSNIIEHTLPIVGKYFYVPRGPIFDHQSDVSHQLMRLINQAKKENIGWIRIDPANELMLDYIKKNISQKIIKAPHDMQPREIFVINIAKEEKQLLSEMKSKTRYNINLAKKKGVIIKIFGKNDKSAEKYFEAFLKLTKEMARRQGIAAHPDEYYKKMFETLPEEMLKLYVAEYEDQVIVANLVLFFGKFATYLHGASSNAHRNVMAPFLLQWQSILDAKAQGCEKYDFGGVKTHSTGRGGHGDWAGITNFKKGFSLQTEPVAFPGSYDIIINPRKYAVYRGLQRAKSFAVKFRR